MCILSLIPRDVELTADIEIDLYNGGTNNPDGHGWAIASDNGLMILGKSLSLDEALDGFTKARAAHSGPALFHSRWATHGSVRVGNCHPFFVGNSHKTVLAHNGVLPSKAWPGKDDDRSDSALFAEDILPRQWKRLGRETVRQSMAEWIGRGNKLVILTVDPRYPANDGFIINEEMGIWDSPTGVWHSNEDYRYNWKTYKSSVVPTMGGNPYASLYANDGSDPTACLYCDMRVNQYQVCTACGTCQDCLETSDDCLCWSGSASLQELEEALDPNAPIPFLPLLED